jgi:hypothetical protein
MLWFLQMNLLNIDKTFSCQQEYTDHTLLLYLQLCCQMIVLSDSLWCSEPFWSTCQSRTKPYPITLLPACKHPTRKLVSSLPVRTRTCLRASHRQAQTGLPNFYFPISPLGGISDKFQAVNGYDFFYQRAISMPQALLITDPTKALWPGPTRRIKG